MQDALTKAAYVMEKIVDMQGEINRIDIVALVDLKLNIIRTIMIETNNNCHTIMMLRYLCY